MKSEHNTTDNPDIQDTTHYPSNHPPVTMHSFIAISLQSTSIGSVETQLLTHPMVCAVVLFTRNITSLGQLTDLVYAIRQIRPNMILMIDQEGLDLEFTLQGIRSGVWRTFKQDNPHNLATYKPYPDFPIAPSQYTLGNIPLPQALDSAYEAGKAIASVLAPLGIIPLSTVLDSNIHGYAPSKPPEVSNPTQQTVTDSQPGQKLSQPNSLQISSETSRASGWVIHGIGRSFGQHIAELAKAKLNGIHSQFQCPRVVKHWIDHGLALDSHQCVQATDPRSASELEAYINRVWLPLKNFIDIAMTSHVIYTKSDDPHTEAGLSYSMLAKLRRYILKPTALIISDCLGMGAIQAKGISLGQAIATASMPNKQDPDIMTDIVLVLNQEPLFYQSYLKQANHQPSHQCSERLSLWQQWSMASTTQPVRQI